MGDFLCKELSKRNKWHLPKYRYLELRYFALQYPEWRRQYRELLCDAGPISIVQTCLRKNGSKIVDRTAEIAIRRKLLSDNIQLIEQVAIESDSDLYPYILKSVTENLSFPELKTIYEIPCEKDMFYDRRRKFYYLLSSSR